MFLGVFCGTTLYMITLSKIFIKINMCIFSFIKQIVAVLIKIFKIPIKIITNILKKVVLKPVLLVFVNLKRILKEYAGKPLNIIKNSTKAKK